ncbi:MAG TPA: alpha-amylase family glycosyl hydrolase [Puia sp.]|nr:alpha-amylase family glycosyl hydrolase [Puia sp.]
MKKNLLRGIAFLCYFLVATIVTFAQDPPQYGTPFAGVPDPRDVTIYQVNMRAFSSTHNLQGVINRLDQIKALGTNVVYLMPVYPVGVLKSVNSPYCIRNFDSVGTEFGTLTDLRTLVDGAHSRGMAVMMDWVVNQTSYDHPWITQHPDWYLKDGNGNITGLNGYTDVAALDFTSTAMRTAMLTQMRYWVFAANVDGFRCDFADNPPIDFWQQTITSLRGITTHKLLLLAEGTRAANYTAGFDYNFGMQFYYNSLKPIFTGGAATAIDNSNTVEYASATGNQQIVRYLTNHDVDGSDGAPVTLFGGKTGSMAAFVVAAYMKGVPFVYNGQEVAFPTAITFPFTSTTIDWTINPDVTAEYTKVIGFRNSSNAIRRGTLVSYTNNDVCAFTKTSGTEEVVVFSNLRNGTINYSLPAALANTTWKDAYSGATVSLGTSLSLTAYQYRVLTNANVPTVPVTGVTLSPTSATLNAGATTQLTATIAPANATNQAVTWTSANTAIATVSASGLVTAVAAGTTTITVKTTDQAKTATATITVNPSTNFTVYFYPPAGWGTGIKIYWWSALPAGVLADGTWPGVNMTAAGSGWYSYTFTNVTSTNLIFNDGSNQTANLSRNKTGWYQNGAWYDTNPGTPTGTTWYQIINRWQPNTYLYDAGNGQVKYGTNPGTDTHYQWTQISAGGGYVQLKNRSTGNYMHVENQNGSVQCGAIQASWYSAMWTIAATGDGWNYIENRWQPSQWIHIENLLGYAQYSGAQTGWYSAEWNLVNPVIGTATTPSQLSGTAADLTNTTSDGAIRLFPNPAPGGQSYLTLPGLASGEQAAITIRDSNGKLLLTKTMTGSGPIGRTLPAGIYFITIQSKRTNETKKLVVP